MKTNVYTALGVALLLITSSVGGAAVSSTTEGGVSADFVVYGGDMTVSDGTVDVDERVGFMADTHTTNARITDLEWSFDDGTTSNGWWTAHRFSEPGTYNVSLTATDNTGATDTETVTITVRGDPNETNASDGDVDASAETAADSEYPAWNESDVYRSGDRVVWNDGIWEAQWWTQGDTPADSRVWEHVEDLGGDGTDDTEQPQDSEGTDEQQETNGTEDQQGSDETQGTDGQQGTDGTESTNETTDTAPSDGDDGTSEPNQSTGDTDTVESGDDMRVVGYYTSWSIYDRDYQPSDVPLDKVTHLNYAFMDVQPNGTVTYGDENADRQNLAEFQELKARHPDTKMQLSIGGWSLSTHFSDAAATQENRERFAESSVELMRQYDFDGIDIDWEFPDGGGAQGNSERPEDPQNYVLLLQEVREELDEAERQDGKEYELSVAAASNPQKTAQLDVPGIAEQVDYVSVMNYDYTGTWSSQTNHNSKLYSASDDPSPDHFNGDAGMRGWADAGMPKEKLVYGAAFFGYGFEGVPDRNNGLYQSFTGPADVGWTVADGATDYRSVQELIDNDSSYVRYWDDEAKVPYVYSARDNVFITYEDPESMAIKAEYVKENGYGGMMFWEFYGDRDETLIDVIDQRLGA